jgi:xanthine dehydrogenase accessory factor
VTPLVDSANAERLLSLVEARRAAAIVIDTTTGAEAVVEADGVVTGTLALNDVERTEVRERMAQDRTGPSADGRLLIHPHIPPRRLLIVGAVHIAQALVDLASIAGYDTTVIDPRAAFATSERFPDTPLRRQWPAEALAEIGLDAHTAVVCLSHDTKIDDPALEAALKSEAFYVGALGSKANQEKRRLRMIEAGVPEARVAHLHGPVGLSIGAANPGEIAVSIMAEVIAVRRGKAA